MRKQREEKTVIKSPILEAQKLKMEKDELAERIFRQARTELYLKLRCLDLALGSLPVLPGTGAPAGTDGGSLFYAADAVLALYQKNRAFVTRLYLHTVFHCLFCHPFGRGRRDAAFWDLSCDIAVEALIDSLALKCVHTASGAFRKSVYARLREKLPVLTAEGICLEMERMKLSEREIMRWQQEFHLDDHSLWTGDEKGKGAPNPNKKRWDDIRERMETEAVLFSREAADEEGKLLEQLRIENRSRQDYREFLRKFTVLREEMGTDPDSFDYIFYHYGMSVYGNMPLIEPQETRERSRIEEFVIVIDTSMSCKGELVKRFLEETYAVLSETESFFKTAQIHILQCDERVQKDTQIRNGEELLSYMEHFELKGGGGTDFRPAFAYVEEKMAKKSYGRLKGLLYFTDGYGVFPVKMPPFETAFVFLRSACASFRDVDVPPWAIKLILSETDFQESAGERKHQEEAE